MASVVESDVVRETSLDWVESLDDVDEDVLCPPPPPLPPRLPPAEARVPSPPPLLPPPPPLPSADVTPQPSSVVRPSRNLRQRYRVSDLDLKSTLGNRSPIGYL